MKFIKKCNMLHNRFFLNLIPKMMCMLLQCENFVPMKKISREAVMYMYKYFKLLNTNFTF